MTFEMLIAKQFMYGVMARTTSKADGSQIVHLLSRRSGLWIPVTQAQIDEQDIPGECLFPVQEIVSGAQIEPGSAGA
jgi:hypothetical protein